MPIIAAALGAVVLAAEPIPQIETSVRPVEAGRVVRLSYSELATITSPPPRGPYPLGLSTPDVRLAGSEYAWETGIRTLVVSTGVGSVSQAISSIDVHVTILDSSK